MARFGGCPGPGRLDRASSSRPSTMDQERETQRQTYQLCRLGFASSRSRCSRWPASASILLPDRPVRRPADSSSGSSSMPWWRLDRHADRLGKPGRDLPALGPLERPGLAAPDGPAGRDGPGRRGPLGPRPRRRPGAPARATSATLAPHQPRPGPGLGRVRPAGQPRRRRDGPPRGRAGPRGEQVDPLARRDRRGRLDAPVLPAAPTGTGWPLQGPGSTGRSRRLLLYLGSTMIWTITLIQVTALIDRRHPRDRRGPWPRWTARTAATTSSAPPPKSYTDLAPRPSTTADGRDDDRDRRLGCDHCEAADAAGPLPVTGSRPLDAAGRSSRSDLGRGKWTFSSRTHFLLDRRAEAPLEVLDALLDDVLGGAGAGGDQDGLDPLEPLGQDLGDAVDQVGVRARATWRSRPAAGCSSCSGSPGRGPRRP